jgi:histidinol-phosphate phosphatase family protein
MRDVDYCGNPADIEIFPEAPGALQRMKRRGFKLIIITNQSGIARGYLTEEDYHDVESELLRRLGIGLIDATYFCPDLPGPSPRRKPAPGMVFEAAGEHQIDLTRSFFIGDKESDVACGRNAGVRTILVQTGYGTGEVDCQPDWIARDLSEAADIITGSTQ